MKSSYKKIYYQFKENEFTSINYSKKKKNIFKIVKTYLPDIYELYIKNDNGHLIKSGYADVPTLKLSQYLQNINYDNEIRVECIFNKKNNKWTPIEVSNKDISSINEIN